MLQRARAFAGFIVMSLQLAALHPALAQPARIWPRQVTVNDAQVTIYQPQAISWPDQKQLTARAALSITLPHATTSILGTIDVTLATATDAQSGLVQLSDPRLIASHFPTLSTQQATDLDAKIKGGLSHMEITSVPLNTVLLSLKQQPNASVAVDNTPPVIFHSTGPASLVVFDGLPVTAPAGNSGVSYAVNTNWDVFAWQAAWYLLNNGVWFRATDALGPYSVTPSVPAAFNAIPKDANFAGVHAHIPAHAPPASTPVPTIFVSSSPAEIIVTDGPAKLANVPNIPLQRVTNTASTVFFDPNDKHFYYLVSGRWFSASSLDGPWQYATTNLPPEFALLPQTQADDAVLAAVPGTAQAERAVLTAQLPHTATLKRSAATLTVSYSGTPIFKPIPGTQIEYAVNTPDEVLKIGARYYACYQGAWFVASSPTGPWALADSIPPEVKSIPPGSPMYNVTYVQVYGAAPQAVTYGYTAGYMMGFISAGVLVYGTGYYYPPVVIPGPVPAFYPYPYTYAGSVWYNPSSGAWARGGTIYGPYGGAAAGGRYYNPTTGGWAQAGAIYGPYGGAGAWSYYNPHTGTYSRGSAVWGGGSGTAHASFYNPRYGLSGSTTQNASPYARWGSSTFTGPNNTVNTASGRNANGAAGGFNSTSGAAGAGYHNRATGNSGGAVRTTNGDVYAGRDGNVYRHTDSGWSKWDNGWNPVNPPSRSSGSQLGATGQGGSRRETLDRSSYQQLEQDRFGRQFGADRQGGERFGGGRSFRR